MSYPEESLYWKGNKSDDILSPTCGARDQEPCTPRDTANRPVERTHQPNRTEHMSEKTSSSSGGIGVLGLLGVAFVILKLCHVIGWSWWWVMAPFWGGLAVGLAMLALGGLLWTVAVAIGALTSR